MTRPIVPAAFRVLPLALPIALAACAVGPNYRRPATPTPGAYKEAAGWTPAQPSDAADRSDWWTVFGDPVLDDLEARVARSNQTLASAEAAYRAAHALVAQDQAALLPTLNAGADVTQSGGGAKSSAQGKTRAVYQATLGATWAPDLWGAVRRNLASARAEAQASAALAAGARLSAQTELAADYIALREDDELKRNFDAAIEAFGRTLKIAQDRYAVGVDARSDVLSARSQLESARAQDEDLVQQRARLEHAIAILTGAAPADLTLAPGPWSLKLPEIPAGLPSALLERRPDIASAERTAKARSEAIGVAVAAFFPNVTLTGQGGFGAANLGGLFAAGTSFWAIGAQAVESVFEGGARLARVRQARAAWDQSVADYRQTVLTAFGQVEDNLAAQRVFALEEGELQRAADDAQAAETIVRNQYAAGTTDFTAVDQAQIAALQVRRALTQMQASRLTTAVSLIEALGGGWSARALPKG